MLHKNLFTNTKELKSDYSLFYTNRNQTTNFDNFIVGEPIKIEDFRDVATLQKYNIFMKNFVYALFFLSFITLKNLN